MLRIALLGRCYPILQIRKSRFRESAWRKKYNIRTEDQLSPWLRPWPLFQLDSAASARVKITLGQSSPFPLSGPGLSYQNSRCLAAGRFWERGLSCWQSGWHPDVQLRWTHDPIQAGMEWKPETQRAKRNSETLTINLRVGVDSYISKLELPPLIFFSFTFFIYWAGVLWQGACACAGATVEVRGKLSGVCSLFPLCGFGELTHTDRFGGKNLFSNGSLTVWYTAFPHLDIFPTGLGFYLPLGSMRGKSDHLSAFFPVFRFLRCRDWTVLGLVCQAILLFPPTQLPKSTLPPFFFLPETLFCGLLTSELWAFEPHWLAMTSDLMM